MWVFTFNHYKVVNFNFLIIFFSCVKKRQTIRKVKYCYITITYKNTKMSDTQTLHLNEIDSAEMHNMLVCIHQQIRDLKNENKSLKIENKSLKIENEELKKTNKEVDEANEILIDHCEYLLDTKEYLIEINKKNEYLEMKIKDFVDLEIENEAWRNGYDKLIKQYDSDFSLTYLKNMNAELENKVKLLEIEIEPLKTTNLDLVKQNNLLENKNRILLTPKEPPKPAPAHRKDTKKDNKTPVFVKPFIRDWVKYYRSADNILYDKFGYPEGKWDVSKKKIVLFTEEEIGRPRRSEKLQILL